MDLGDYLYLFITLGVVFFQFASAALGKKKKTQTAGNTNVPKEPKGKGKSIRQGSQNIPVAKDQPTQNEYVNPEFKSFMPTSDVSKTKEEARNDLPSVKCENKKALINLSDANELKKAIIYSEVFARKF
ncbi:MAG: hypothetical protein ACRC9Q_08895 [Bacteroidales bacterium]